MKVLVLGATGGTGRQVVAQTVHEGHDVTVFVRHPERLPIRDDRVRIIVGDIRSDTAALADAMRGQDVVVSALGIGGSLKPDGLIAASVPAILKAMDTEGTRRLIFTSAYGVGETRSQVPFLPRIPIRLLLGDIYADKEAGEQTLRRSALDWTIVYPVTLTNGKLTGRYRAGEQLALTGFPTISRADLADFLVKQISDRKYIGKGVLISN
jgi:putative NADH-flavin reductase